MGTLSGNGAKAIGISNGKRSNSVRPSGHILVVDDESVICDTVKEILSNAGFACDTMYTAADALARLAARTYDCLISDVRMPGMDGLELIKKARATDSDLEVVLMTGLVDTKTAKAALQSDARDYLVKPFDVEDLVHCATAAVEHRRLVLENREYQQHLEEKVAQQAESIRRQFLGAIQSLAKAVEARDDYTRGHSERVADLALDMALRMGLSPEKADLVRIAGLLHDIGKIGIPDGILQKRGPLIETERQVMQTHTTVGRDIVALMGPPTVLTEGVLHHHERWDGKGYPEGRTRMEIPLVGRILAVADAWDAMTSARPYRDAFPVEVAMERLLRSRGNQLDPELVDAAVEVLETRTEAEMAKAVG